MKPALAILILLVQDAPSLPSPWILDVDKSESAAMLTGKLSSLGKNETYRCGFFETEKEWREFLEGSELQPPKTLSLAVQWSDHVLVYVASLESSRHMDWEKTEISETGTVQVRLRPRIERRQRQGYQIILIPVKRPGKVCFIRKEFVGDWGVVGQLSIDKK